MEETVCHRITGVTDDRAMLVVVPTIETTDEIIAHLIAAELRRRGLKVLHRKVAD